MSAGRVVRHLLEEPQDDPLDIGPLDRYTGPVAFNQNIKDLLDHALFLKEQAQQAGALQALGTMYGTKKEFTERDIDRALLLIATQELEDEHAPRLIADRLQKLMHSIWS